MGLETVIIAFFVIGTIVVVACTLTAGANHLIKCSYEGYTASSQTLIDRLHTSIEISNVTRTDNYVHLTVENTGETELSNFDHWDVIVVKNGTSFDLTNGTGFNLTFINDFINPRILDPDESIDMNLTSTFNSGDSLYITVITENGITSSANYTI